MHHMPGTFLFMVLDSWNFNQLRTHHTYKSQTNYDLCRSDCSIAEMLQDTYEHQDEIGTLNCGHDYHADCLKKWLLVKNVCPVCKSEALPMAKTGL